METDTLFSYVEKSHFSLTFDIFISRSLQWSAPKAFIRPQPCNDPLLSIGPPEADAAPAPDPGPDRAEAAVGEDGQEEESGGQERCQEAARQGQRDL